MNNLVLLPGFTTLGKTSISKNNSLMMTLEIRKRLMGVRNITRRIYKESIFNDFWTVLSAPVS